ncbi:XdhC family protein [Allokutzneria albata]|uniref:Xanthine dehydrogenase accessory factor n=1 Tax=Allokutzneria albata TaxID=211114 RepID=A0A1G9UJU6_ALLAB|nr:XdhC family protein [Allokutzneria albata]SDM60199.1 xanthine dehydrogenase accessory factor [Allokutzneria albata]
MLEIAEELRAWSDAGRTFAVATVIGVSGSAPRPIGASMAVSADGAVIGNVSGGCVDGAVYELCREAIRTGESSTHRFGYSDESAFAVGLSCGGVIEVFVQPAPVIPPSGATVARSFTGRTMLVHNGKVEGTVGSLDAAVLSSTETTVLPGVLVEVPAPPPRMLIFGALDFAAALTTVGTFLGYRVTVCDARPVFATPERFPGAEVVVDWPHRYLEQTTVDDRTAICVLTHDSKFDIPVLTRALRIPVGYVGAMGSRRTHAERLELLRGNGVTPEELARLRSPIGLDIGGLTPEETALSIAAEIVACRRNGSGRPLSAVCGPIHTRLDAMTGS